MADRSKIIIARCGDYREGAVAEAFERIAELAAGNGVTIPARSKILLKPSLLAPDPPEKAVTTHPAVFLQAARFFKKYGNDLFYGDSPGMGDFRSVAKASGISEAAEKEGVRAMNFEREKEVGFRSGRFCKKFIIADCLSPDLKIVSLPKLKTHCQMIYTGAIKNVFGCVPGTRKPESHLRMLTADNFAMMVADLFILLKPAFAIMDAVIGMEGNGPRGGTPRKTGFIIAGEDCLAVDSICARIMNLNPYSVPILKYASEFGGGNIDLQNIEVIGDDWRELVVKDFKNITAALPLNFAGAKAIGILKRFVINRPAVNYGKCVLCLKCLQKCPVEGKAIYLKGKRIRYRHDKCIRCYCCQEICPEGAIYMKKKLWWKFLSAFYNISKRI